MRIVLKTREEQRTAVEGEVRSTDLPGFRAQILDISESGMQLSYNAKAGSEPDRGESIAFHMPVGNQIARGLAKVVWTRKQGDKIRVGLVFERVSNSSRATMETLRVA